MFSNAQTTTRSQRVQRGLASPAWAHPMKACDFGFGDFAELFQSRNPALASARWTGFESPFGVTYRSAVFSGCFWSHPPGSNRRPADYES